MVSGVLTVAVPSLLPPRMLSRWILIVWWGVAALSSAGHLVFFNLADSNDDFTWWGPIFAQFMICTAWALVTRAEAYSAGSQQVLQKPPSRLGRLRPYGNGFFSFPGDHEDIDGAAVPDQMVHQRHAQKPAPAALKGLAHKDFADLVFPSKG